MLNSFIVASSVTIVALLFHSMAGYSLARLRFPGRQGIFILILSTLMIPFYTIMIPLVLLIRELGWIDTYWALIVPAIPHAFGIFWFRTYFLGLPRLDPPPSCAEGQSVHRTSEASDAPPHR